MPEDLKPCQCPQPVIAWIPTCQTCQRVVADPHKVITFGTAAKTPTVPRSPDN